MCSRCIKQATTRCWSLSTDRDFEPPCEEEDDEETIEVEEQQEGNDAETHRREIELLKEEGLLPLDQLLSSLNLPQVLTTQHICTGQGCPHNTQLRYDANIAALNIG